MFVMTTRVNKKKIAMILGAVVALIVIIGMAIGSGKSQSTGSDVSVNTNDDRVQFLASYGWEVVTSPAETSQVRIPANTSEVFERYNTLQKTMGYDLSEFAGKTVMRYVYTVKNFPGATEPVYATILISNNRVIGGDITDTAPTGKIQSFEKQSD